jgi:hypothetical protein
MMMPTTDTGASDGNEPGQQRGLRRPARLALGTGAGVGAELVLSYHHQALETISVVCDLGLPVLLIVVVVGIILCGSEARQERAFRLLRWLADRPEPPSPDSKPREG